MIGIEGGLVGGFGLIILIVAALAFVLYLVPVPLWIAAVGSLRQDRLTFLAQAHEKIVHLRLA